MEPMDMGASAFLLGWFGHDTGDYSIGQSIPTEMELVAYYGVSRATVRQAMRELEQDSYINRVPGRGTFVV